MISDVTLLAVLQGIAEFLPISSSGHLVLGKGLLGLHEVGMRLDVFLHVGTLLAVFVFYAKTIFRIVAERDVAYVAKIAAGSIPVCLVGLFLKDELGGFFSDSRFVGGALIFTGTVLSLTRFLPKGTFGVTWWRAIAVGLAQCVAILPGVSRSGMTLAAARATGVDARGSAEFSFLISAIPIAGAAVLEGIEACGEASAAAAEVPWGLTLYGCALSAVVGWLALAFLVRTLQGRWFWLFGPYCISVGLLALILV